MSLEVPTMKRVPSHQELSHFRALTKKDSFEIFVKETNKLLLTAPVDEKNVRFKYYEANLN
jgi:hypothetical protein